MINKQTIAEQWKQNPNKKYYIIKNPKINKGRKKIDGLDIKIVEYVVSSMDSKFVYFEKIDKDKNKRYPNVLPFDKRFPDAENEVFYTKDTPTVNKKNCVDSYGIFNEYKLADFHKLVRLHRISIYLSEMYKFLKTTKPDVKSDFTLLEVEKYFTKIQDTNYFERLETIQSDFPDLAAM
jgi:hypothetical protein